MAWRTKDGRTSDETNSNYPRRGTEVRRGINNHAANMAASTARIFETEERIRYTREHGAGWVLFADDED